ncbi:conserved Plasmodium protein, unknown function [Plasmodium gallinaceum]|uniref:WD repeat-containing protein n=1 Tax=Plasmodium gallinaceum TaxID=5849 RepID=A0A1J1GV24_PLAGA|nr:conserved Plasmodium protein, unknown function [Plasmodium gallinaceum]CRG96314.1 conserved Plasmodium protein, unknown function [Plasmodium gallinaceum]
MSKNKIIKEQFLPHKFINDTKEQETLRINELDKLDKELLKNEYTSKLEKELILKNVNFKKDLNMLKLNFGGNMIKNKPILTKNNISYFCSDSSILLIDFNTKKKSRIVTSFFIDKMFYFYDKKCNEEYLIIKSFNNYIYLYHISNKKFNFIKRFFIKNLFYINSFGKNGELCFATWELCEKKMYVNFFLLRFIFNYETNFYDFNEKSNKNKKKNISSNHITYTFSSDSECDFDLKYFPNELTVDNSEYEGEEQKQNQTKKKKNITKNENIYITAKLKIKPILKIKYIYFSMIDLNTNLNKLVLANNNIILIYDIIKKCYNIIYFKNYISSIKISDENFLCIGFINGYIYILLFDELKLDKGNDNINNLKENQSYQNIYDQIKTFHFISNSDSIDSTFPYIESYEVDYINDKLNNSQIGIEVEKKNDINYQMNMLNIPYINFQFHKNRIVNIQKFHIIKYKWHSHSVYNLTVEGKKIISSGEEAVILFYDLQKGSYEFISHLGLPCYYIYLNKRKNIIICNALNNSIFFINYNHRLFFYKYNGINMPLSLKNLFYNYSNVHLNIKNSIDIFLDQINDKYDYTNEMENNDGNQSKGIVVYNNQNGVNENSKNNFFNNDFSENSLINCSSESDENEDDDENEENENEDEDENEENENEDEDEEKNEDEKNENENENDIKNLRDSSKEDENNNEEKQKLIENRKKRKNFLSFKSIQRELEKKIYNNINIENNLYKKYQISFYCDSNNGLIFCFLTTFVNLQLYNIEKDKHIKFLCPLKMVYKSRTDIEKVNDMELVLFSYNHNRNLLMTIEKRNYLMEEFIHENKCTTLLYPIYNVKIWYLKNNLEYYNFYNHTITSNNLDNEEQQNNKAITEVEKYKMIISHPFLSIFILLEHNGNICFWCLEKSEKIFENSIYKDYEVDCFDVNDTDLTCEVKGCNINNLYTEENDEDIILNGNENENNKTITIIKNINYNNHSILNGDISKDGRILCICHNKFISIWDTITIKTLAIINHPLYTSLDEYIFNLYKGVEVLQAHGNIYLCFYSFDTLFIYSLHQFHLVYEKKFRGIIEYIKFDKYTYTFLAIGITKRVKKNKNHLTQKNYIYEFTQNYLKKKKLFYSSKDKPIIALDFAPLNSQKNIPLCKDQKSTVLVALNSKFQINTFYFNNFPNFIQLK